MWDSASLKEDRRKSNFVYEFNEIYKNTIKTMFDFWNFL
jgi:hypothetical protein